MIAGIRERALLALVVGVFALAPRPSRAFSVLAHQGVVDSSWERVLVPALRRRFPDAEAEDLIRARAFAYGGSHIADLGYFPLGNLEFTDLLHYVRSGDFVAALVESATSLDKYAFALGALAHYVTDNIGHPEATNRAVAEIYPKLRKKYGDRVTYADSHSAHLATEFRFDVLQLSRSEQSPDLFHHAIAFEVSKPALERAFQATYGLRLDDLFTSTDTAIATYRWGFRGLVHEATGIAWRLYRSDIQRLAPKATKAEFVYELPRTDFEKEFGKTFREPGYFTRFIAFFVKLVPNVGPFKRLPYKPLPAHVRELFITALDHAADRYRSALPRGHQRHLELENTNLDTGRPTRVGDYEPADHAYATLLAKLDARDFTGVPSALRADVLRFYRDRDAFLAAQDDNTEWRKVQRALARLARLDPR